MFYAFDEWPEHGVSRRQKEGSAKGLWSAAVNAMGTSMLILCLLDFVRLAVGADLVVKG